MKAVFFNQNIPFFSSAMWVTKILPPYASASDPSAKILELIVATGQKNCPPLVHSAISYGLRSSCVLLF